VRSKRALILEAITFAHGTPPMPTWSVLIGRRRRNVNSRCVARRSARWEFTAAFVTDPLVGRHRRDSVVTAKRTRAKANES
jgi:hypothetical protein